MNIFKVDKNLYDIRLDLEEVNIKNFISSWVYKDKELCYLVDPGPVLTIKRLKQGLDKLGIGKNDLNFILLTHIHLDHAGGIGHLVSLYPQSQVICHPRGIKHLISPEKLWEGSLKILGNMARLYGKVKPVPENRIKYQNYIANGKIKVIETPGHAPHHQSYLFDRYLFVGEAGGFHISLSKSFYMRPATPPIFEYEISNSSIQKLLSENLKDYKICYPHLGMSENAEKMLLIAQEQLSLWIQIITDFYETNKRSDLIEELMSKLKEKDKYFANYELLDKDLKKRELTFAGNSIRGILGYIQKRKKENND
jgi:glyoxylase-like metal-dependent hydrolase (beta-lactamase superfamily II)